MSFHYLTHSFNRNLMKVTSLFALLLIGMPLALQAQTESAGSEPEVEINEVANFESEDLSQVQLEINHQTSDQTVGCDTEVFLTFSVIPAGTYQAISTILATGTIQSGTVTMLAGSSITLDPNFEVSSGAELEVLIGDCTF